MNGRFKIVMLIAAIAAFAAFLPASAGANITPTASTVFSTTAPGAAVDYTIIQEFDYGNGAEPAAGSEDMKKWIVDSPAGLVGNPNAIPEADRCDPAAFDPSGTMSALNTTGACPASSKVGEATVYLVSDADDGACPGPPFGVGSCLPGGSAVGVLSGTIYLLKNSPAAPEVPVVLGTIFTGSTSYQAIPCGARTPAASPPCTLQPKTKSKLEPVTTDVIGNDGDFRIRTVPMDYSAPPVVYLPSPPHTAFASGGTQLHIRRIDQKLIGLAPNGNKFLSNPTNCGPWESQTYAHATLTNAGTLTGLDPENPSDLYQESNVDTVSPDCSTLPAFPASATMTLSTLARGSNPQVDVEIKGISSYGDDYPKSVVTTMPASITTDVQGIATPCEIADRDANTCPAASKVGSATATTPLLSGGLTGDVYMIRGAGGKAVPDLSIFFNNPPNSLRPFRLDGTTKFVGPNNNQIETTFAQAPQSPVSSFKLTINGGTAEKPDSLLTISVCPSDSASPPDGPITFNITGFSGQTATNSSVPALEDCFGLANLKKISRCVKSKLKVSPSYQSRDQLMKSELWVQYKERRRNGKLVRKYKRVQLAKSSPFRFNKKLSAKKFNRGTYRYKVRAVYKPTVNHPSPMVIAKYSKFKYCGK